MFRETVRTVLQTAKGKGVKSIAIPSLGVGNLNYPASVSARILFDQVIAFHAQFPNASIQKFHFVIYEKKVYEEFSKEYAQRMNDGAQVHHTNLHGASLIVLSLYADQDCRSICKT